MHEKCSHQVLRFNSNLSKIIIIIKRKYFRKGFNKMRIHLIRWIKRMRVIDNDEGSLYVSIQNKIRSKKEADFRKLLR